MILHELANKKFGTEMQNVRHSNTKEGPYVAVHPNEASKVHLKASAERQCTEARASGAELDSGDTEGAKTICSIQHLLCRSTEP